MGFKYIQAKLLYVAITTRAGHYHLRDSKQQITH